jgi:hypothetical protein
VSKSARTSHLRATKSEKRSKAPAVERDACTRAPGRPWVIGGIDLGPALAAIHDLAAWAFGIAARDVADWPEGRRRVRSARRCILARLRGKHPQIVPVEDIVFTAGVLARIFEAELRLPLSEVMAMFEQLGFPTDDVPLVPRTPSAVRQQQAPTSVPIAAIAPVVPLSPLSPLASLRPRHVPVQPAPAPVCNGCGQLDPRFRTAA